MADGTSDPGPSLWVSAAAWANVAPCRAPKELYVEPTKTSFLEDFRYGNIHDELIIMGYIHGFHCFPVVSLDDVLIFLTSSKNLPFLFQFRNWFRSDSAEAETPPVGLL